MHGAHARPSRVFLVPTFLSVITAGWLLWVAAGTAGPSSSSAVPTRSPAPTQTARVVRVPVTTTPTPLPTIWPVLLTATAEALTPHPTFPPYQTPTPTATPTPTSVFVEDDTGAANA